MLFITMEASVVFECSSSSSSDSEEYTLTDRECHILDTCNGPMLMWALYMVNKMATATTSDVIREAFRAHCYLARIGLRFSPLNYTLWINHLGLCHPSTVDAQTWMGKQTFLRNERGRLERINWALMNQ